MSELGSTLFRTAPSYRRVDHRLHGSRCDVQRRLPRWTCRMEMRSPIICEGCALHGVAFRLPRVQRFPLGCAESACECADGSIASSQIRCGPVSKIWIYRTSASEPFCVPIMELHGKTTERDRMGQRDHKDKGINREQGRWLRCRGRWNGYSAPVAGRGSTVEWRWRVQARRRPTMVGRSFLVSEQGCAAITLA